MARTRGIVGAALVIPPRLRRFVLANWLKPGDELAEATGPPGGPGIAR